MFGHRHVLQSRTEELWHGKKVNERIHSLVHLPLDAYTCLGHRFLCPPPSAVFLGNNWWHETRRGDTVPPKTVISISGEPSPLESVTEWSTPLGKNFDVADPPQPSSTTYMGRCIGKQLFITDYDDRKKKVEALVRVVQPADEQDGEPERLLGVFPSKPIKVISKPSKKRQSAKNLERT